MKRKIKCKKTYLCQKMNNNNRIYKGKSFDERIKKREKQNLWNHN